MAYYNQGLFYNYPIYYNDSQGFSTGKSGVNRLALHALQQNSLLVNVAIKEESESEEILIKALSEYYLNNIW